MPKFIDDWAFVWAFVQRSEAQTLKFIITICMTRRGRREYRTHNIFLIG